MVGKPEAIPQLVGNRVNWRNIPISLIDRAYNFVGIPMLVQASIFPDPEEHAAAILEALKGDYQKALEYMPVYRDEFGEIYARRLAMFLTPQGEC